MIPINSQKLAGCVSWVMPSCCLVVARSSVGTDVSLLGSWSTPACCQCLSGLGKGDILSIKLEHLKDDGIHVHISKTKKDIIIEWTDALRKSVHTIRALPRPRKVTGLDLFCTRDGRPYTVTGFSSIWQRKMKAAIEQGVIKERFTDHDLRAKSASDTDIEHATRLLAHLDRKTTQRYYRRKAEKVRPLR